MSSVGIGERRAVHADLVGAGVDRRRGVRLGPDAAADGQRNEQLGRHRADRGLERAASFDRRGDVEDDHLVDPFGVVAPRERRRIARVREASKLTPLTTQPLRTSRQAISRLDSMRSAFRRRDEVAQDAETGVARTSPGWNCTPKTWSRLDGGGERGAVCRTSPPHSGVTGAA